MIIDDDWQHICKAGVAFMSARQALERLASWKAELWIDREAFGKQPVAQKVGGEQNQELVCFF